MVEEDAPKRVGKETFSVRGSENLNPPKRPAPATNVGKSASKTEPSDAQKGERAEKK